MSETKKATTNLIFFVGMTINDLNIKAPVRWELICALTHSLRFVCLYFQCLNAWVVSTGTYNYTEVELILINKIKSNIKALKKLSTLYFKLNKIP